jgi:hypothetical protein
MNPQVPVYISALFIGLVLALFFLLMNGVKNAFNKIRYPESKKRKAFLIIPIAISVWLIVTAILSVSGFFLDFTLRPLKPFFLLFIPLVIASVVAFSRPVRILLLQIPPRHLIYMQSFRIGVGLILWLLYLNSVIPVQMTLEGRNYDIFAGVLAPLVAYLAFERGRFYPRLVLAYNFVSLALLINSIVIAILSAPIPIRVFMNEPANILFSYYPFVWLPGFIGPLAFFLHFVSIRQIYLMAKSDQRKRVMVI